MRRFGKSWRRTWIALGVGLVALGAGLAGLGRDGSAPRRLIAAPEASWPQGFTPDGRSFLTLSPEGFLTWDATTWQARRPWTLRAMPISAFSADGQTCIGVHGFDAESAKIAWVDVASGAIRANFFAGLPRVIHLAFADGDRSVRALLADRTATLRAVVTWDLASGAETRRAVRGPTGVGMFGAWPAGFAHDGRTLAYFDPIQMGVQLWDVETDRPLGAVLRTPSTKLARFYPTAAFTPGDDRLVISRADGAVEVWDLASRRWLRTIPVHPSGYAANDLQISPDGRTLASSRFHHAGPSWVDRAWSTFAGRFGGTNWQSQRTNEVVVVDLLTGARLADWIGSFHPRFSPDGRTIVTHESWTGQFAVRDAPPPDPAGQ